MLALQGLVLLLGNCCWLSTVLFASAPFLQGWLRRRYVFAVCIALLSVHARASGMLRIRRALQLCDGSGLDDASDDDFDVLAAIDDDADDGGDGVESFDASRMSS